MSVKWTGIHSESGILRKSEFNEKKEELFVFGYSCKLFRDDDKALHIDQGKHLIPWMGDESLKIDRYDARGALHELASVEAPPGGYDWRVELTRAERRAELLCDEERYRALHTDEHEEEMYKEEELKRLHAAGYGQVGFNYEAGAAPPQPPEQTPPDADELFLPADALKALLPAHTIFPETEKQNAIIEKTAKFIASQGAQMEILIKAKQGDNPQFQFLNKECALHPYYAALVALVKAGKWPEKPPQHAEERPPEPSEEYLHPSLAAAVIESAPSIPSIAYRPSADCDYTLLVSRLRGSPPPARGTPPPPGTAPLPPVAPATPAAPPTPRVTLAHAHIERGPVLFANVSAEAKQRAQREQPPAVPAAPPAPPAPAALPAAASTGLSLMKHYDSDTGSDTDESSSTELKESAAVSEPPEEVRLVIDKMAAYVARNGNQFADIVRAKQDPRFAFLQPGHPHYAYYARLLRLRHAQAAPGHKANAVVSFSIKKHKEPDPILPRPALPYESSSDEESEGSRRERREEAERSGPEPQAQPDVPPVLVYKLEGGQGNKLPIVKSFEALPAVKLVPKPAPLLSQTNELTKVREKPAVAPPHSQHDVVPPKIDNVEENVEKKEVLSQKSEVVSGKSKYRESPDRSGRERRRRDRKTAYRSKSASREKRRVERRGGETQRERRDRDHDRNRRQASKDEAYSEIISLVDNSDDLIDLTEEPADCKGAAPGEQQGAGGARRTEELLRRAGLRTPAALPAASLASAMVDTLESLRKKEEEEKRRRRDKRRRRERRELAEAGRQRRGSRRRRSSAEERSDGEGCKRKKHKKEKKHGSRDKKKRKESEEEDLPIDIDLTSTLRGLRTASPARDLGLAPPPASRLRPSSGEQSSPGAPAARSGKRCKQRRQYSEGEWSSDSGAPSDAEDSERGD